MRSHQDVTIELDALFDGPRGYWEESPKYPVEDWKYEVANGDTRESYREWLYNNLIEEEN